MFYAAPLLRRVFQTQRGELGALLGGGQAEQRQSLAALPADGQHRHHFPAPLLIHPHVLVQPRIQKHPGLRQRRCQGCCYSLNKVTSWIPPHVHVTAAR